MPEIVLGVAQATSPRRTRCSGGHDAKAASCECWFERLVCSVDTRLGSYLLRVLGSVENAQDVRQDTFVRAFQCRASIRMLPDPERYIFGIAHGLALHALRSDRRRTLYESQAVREREHYELEATAVFALEEYLATHLDPLDRRLVLLRYADDFNSSEIADMTTLSPIAVRKRLSRATTRLAALARQTALAEA